jgi:hypothetical protein
MVGEYYQQVYLIKTNFIVRRKEEKPLRLYFTSFLCVKYTGYKDAVQQTIVAMPISKQLK